MITAGALIRRPVMHRSWLDRKLQKPRSGAPGQSRSARMPSKARLELVPSLAQLVAGGGLLDPVQEAAAALSPRHLPGVLILRRLRYGPVSVGLDIVEQV